MDQLEVDYCVVGAGFAGLTAALRLKQAGHAVALLEARDRVGGRTWTVTRDDGAWIDRGGAWFGPGQDAIIGLMREYGVASYKQYVEGENVMLVDGKPHRYKGTVPLNLAPWVTANLGGALLRIGQMTKKIPLEAPWEAPDADELDAQSIGSWLRNPAHAPFRAARDLLETAMPIGLYTSHPSEVSMLFALYQMASAGGPQFALGVEGGAEDSRPVGGMGAVYEPMRAELGDAVHLEQPVRRVVQDGDGVIVVADGMEVRARRAIVAVPISIAGQIDYEPMLPTQRAHLHQRMPQGAVFKIAAIYDEPFWRADGLSGESVSARSPLPLTIDACTPAGTPGVLNTFPAGPVARELTALPADERRRVVLDELAKRFGPKAATPAEYIEQNWTTERWSGGGMIAHAPPGVLTQFGPALRAPCGRIHWAGTESSAAMYGFIDGAVRSGERAAREVAAADGAAAAPTEPAATTTP